MLLSVPGIIFSAFLSLSFVLHLKAGIIKVGSVQSALDMSHNQSIKKGCLPLITWETSLLLWEEWLRKRIFLRFCGDSKTIVHPSHLKSAICPLVRIGEGVCICVCACVCVYTSLAAGQERWPSREWGGPGFMWRLEDRSGGWSRRCLSVCRAVSPLSLEQDWAPIITVCSPQTKGWGHILNTCSSPVLFSESRGREGDTGGRTKPAFPSWLALTRWGYLIHLLLLSGCLLHLS